MQGARAGSSIAHLPTGCAPCLAAGGAAPAPAKQQPLAPSGTASPATGPGSSGPPPAAAPPVAASRAASLTFAIPHRKAVASPFIQMALARSASGPPALPHSAAPPPAAAPARAPPSGPCSRPPAPSHDLARCLEQLLQLKERARPPTGPTTPSACGGSTAGAAAAAAAQARSTDVLAYLAGWGRVAEQQGCATPHPSGGSWRWGRGVPGRTGPVVLDL